MSTSHADKARLAHRVLRLKENGVGSEQRLRGLAGRGLADADGESLDQAIGSSTAHPLGAVALATYDFIDAERPGPTDAKLVERLFNQSLTDIWKQWDEAVTANLEQTLDNSALKEWRASVARDQKAAEEAWGEAGFGPDEIHPYFGHNRFTEGAANALYDLGRQGHLDGSINESVATIKVALIDSAVYTVNLATHQFMSSVASVVAASGALTTKTVAAGVFDADDVTLASVTGAQSEAIIGYQSSAVGGGADVANTAQRLIWYIDTATGLPVTPNGGNITITWDSGSNRIFKL